MKSKYLIELDLDYDKKFCESFILQNHLDFQKLKKTKKWHNNIPINLALKEHFGPITKYLKDEILVLTLFPGVDIPIHADGAGTRKENTYNVSINIPVRNCNKRTQTIFWDFENNDSIEYIHYEDLGTRDIVNKQNLTKHLSYSFCDKPALFRNEYPHSVENQNDKLRLMLSWRFLPHYTWNDVVEICEKYNLIPSVDV